MTDEQQPKAEHRNRPPPKAVPQSSGVRTALKAGRSRAGTSVSQDEIALAGKGFSEEVEKEYRKNNANLDYAWINRMETIRISPRQMENFVEDGRLVLGNKGGRP